MARLKSEGNGTHGKSLLGLDLAGLGQPEL